jgi:hypothetical protein
MEHLQHEDEVFEVLYNLSVGLERLLKIAVILIEHNDSVDQNAYERSLITHSHTALLGRIAKLHHLRLSVQHNTFLQMLSTFYKSHRYGRYCTAGLTVDTQEMDALHDYIKKYLKIAISRPGTLFATENSRRIKQFLGTIVGKIAAEVYGIICEEARHRGLYTFELRCGSKAEKIFGRKQYDFADEEVLWKELIVFFVHSKENEGHLGFLKRMTPLEFDPGLAAEYLQCIGSDEKKLENMDELESLYDGIDDKGERLDMLNALGNPCVLFEPLEDSDEGE